MRRVAMVVLFALAGCTSSFKNDARRYVCARDGGDQCLDGWRCGLDGFCFDPGVSAPRACERQLELAHPGTDCTGGWRCGLDDVCFDPTVQANRACDRPLERDAGYDCSTGWHCGLDGFCFDPSVHANRRCDRALERDGGPYDCSPGWNCGLDGFCFDPSVRTDRRCDRALERDGGPYDCSPGWHCSLDGTCFDPDTAVPRRCDRAFERDGGPYDCAPGWRCSEDGICFNATIASARPCNHDELAGDGGPFYDCAPAWRCGRDNTCFDPTEPLVRSCDRAAANDAGAAVECAASWRCGLDNLCYDATQAVTRACSPAFDTDGGNVDCFSGWRCSARSGQCFNPAIPEARVCDRAEFLATGLAPECAPGWRCGLDNLCYALADAGTHACDLALERGDGGLALGSDCSAGWRCGLTGVCQDRSVGAPYQCLVDSDCEQSWRCHPLQHVCLLVTDRAPPATGLATPDILSPRLNLPVPDRLVYSGPISWPHMSFYSGEQPALYAFTTGNTLHMMVHGKHPLLRSDGTRDRLIDMTCPITASAIEPMAAWQELVVVKRTSGVLDFYGFAPLPQSPSGETPYPPNCRLMGSLTPPPGFTMTALGSIPLTNVPLDLGPRGNFFGALPGYGAGIAGLSGASSGVQTFTVTPPDGGVAVASTDSTPFGACNTFPPDGSILDVAGLTTSSQPGLVTLALTRDGISVAQSVWETSPPYTPPLVCASSSFSGQCNQSRPVISSCAPGNLQPDGTCTGGWDSGDAGCDYPTAAGYLRPVDVQNPPNPSQVRLSPPVGYAASRLYVSDRTAPPPGAADPVVAAVGVLFSALDGGPPLFAFGTLRARAQVPPGAPTPAFVLDSAGQWSAAVAPCPGSGPVLNAVAALATDSSGGPKAGAFVRCGDGKAAPDGGNASTVIRGRTWFLYSNDIYLQYPSDGGAPQAVVGASRWTAYPEDEAPFASPFKSAEGAAWGRVFAGANGRVYVYPPMSTALTTPVQGSVTVMDQLPDAVFRVSSQPGSLLAQSLGTDVLAVVGAVGYEASGAGFVGEPYVGKPSDFALPVVGPVRGAPNLVILETLVMDVAHFPFGPDQEPQIVAVPVGGALTPPGVGELVTTGGRTRLYVSSGDAIWSADVTDQLVNQYEPPAQLTRSFSPVPGVSLRSMALGAAVGADGGVTGQVIGYVIAGTDVYEFEGVPPFWSASKLPTNIGAGAPIDVFRRVNAQGQDVFRVGFDTGVLAALPAPVPLTGPLPGGQTAYRIAQLCGDTYALGSQGLYLYGSGDGDLPDGGWSFVYGDAGTRLFESTSSFFTASPRGDVVEFSLRSDAGFPFCP